jgi:hypothetical protein
VKQKQKRKENEMNDLNDLNDLNTKHARRRRIIETVPARVIFDRVVQNGVKHVDRRVVLMPKSESKLMKILSTFLGDSFYQNFWTTLFYTMYSAGDRLRLNNSVSWWTVLHEYVHILQLKRISCCNRVVYSFKYLYPLSLGIVLGLTGIGLTLVTSLTFLLSTSFSNTTYCVLYGVSSVLCLSGLLCFVPKLRDKYREQYELEAYGVSMLCKWYAGELNDDYVLRLARLFSDMSYYRMSRYDDILIVLKELRERVEAGAVDHDVFSLVFDNDPELNK